MRAGAGKMFVAGVGDTAVVARGREIARFIAGVRATTGLITGAGATERLSWHRTRASMLQ